MKKILIQIIFLASSLITSLVTTAQNVGIGTTSPNAALDVSSTTNGFLPPRLTIAQRNSIINPATGVVIFCTDNGELEIFDGYSWKNMVGSGDYISTAFPYIKICDQIWMGNNLTVSRYRNGDEIPQVQNREEWAGATYGAWCWYNNDSATFAATFGKLYNWYAVNDPRGLAPAGWHIPSDSEWIRLSTCLGGNAVSGGKMKEAGTVHWQSPNTGATNSSGFTALPAGGRNINGDGEFNNYNGGIVNYWSSTSAENSNMAWVCGLDNSTSIFYYFNIFFNKGYSVRCVKD